MFVCIVLLVREMSKEGGNPKADLKMNSKTNAIPTVPSTP